MTQPINPTAPVNPVITIQPVAVTAPERDASQAPNPLAKLTNGTTVEGFVVNRDAQNNPILRTAIGDLKVGSEIFLKTGSEVKFVVDSSQASLARILTVDGLPPDAYNAKNTYGLAGDTIAKPTFLNTQLLSQQTQDGSPLKATILQALVLQSKTPQQAAFSNAFVSSSAAPLGILSQLAQLRAGNYVRLTLLDLKLPPTPLPVASLPAGDKINTLLPPLPQRTGGLPPTQAAPTSATAGPTNALGDDVANAAVQPASKQVIADEPAIQPARQQATLATANNAPGAPQASSIPTNLTPTPQSPPIAAPYAATPQQQALPTNSSAQASVFARPFATAPLPPNSIQADVIGHEADGANILHTPFATLKLYTDQPLPTGSTLIVSAEADTAPATPAPVTALAADENFIQSATRDWTSLDEALTILRSVNENVAREVAQRLPSANNKLTSNALNFIAAVQAGDVNELIGKRAARLLEASAPDLHKRLKADLTQIQSNFNSSPLSHWAWVALPMLVNGEIQQARLYISKEPPKDEASSISDTKGQRFILEVGLSAIGDMQFDGFVKSIAMPSTKAQSFDLVVRASKPLDDEIAGAIREIFSNSLAVTGMRGQILFQSGAQHFVRPLTEKPITAGGYDNTILA